MNRYLLSKRIKWIAGIALFILCLANTVCAGQDTAQEPKKLFQGKITLGMETWPGYFPLIVAREKGYFKEAGLDVEIKRYIALGELSKDYKAGKMQGRANLTLDAVKESLDGLEHKVVLAIDYSNGSDAIVARKDIETVQAFRGKRVGYEPDTLEEFFMIWALSENEMNLSDVISLSANPEETAKKLKEGQIDVAVTHEPFLSELVSSGNFHAVYSSSDAPGLITDILTFRKDFIDAYPETVEALLAAYFKGLAFWKEHPAQANAITAKEFNDTPEGIAAQLKGIKMLDKRDNQIAFTFAAGLNSLYGNMRQIGKFILKHQKPTAGQPSLDTDQLIERRFIKNITRE